MYSKYTFTLLVAGTLLISGCAIRTAQKKMRQAEDAHDIALRNYEACLQNRYNNCEREKEILELRRYSLEQRTSDYDRQNAEWQQAADSMQEYNEAQERSRIQKEKLKLEREREERLRREQYYNAPKRVDRQCMNDCRKRYSRSYCNSACSY